MEESELEPLIEQIIHAEPGNYFKHYKGTIYALICIAVHTETEEQLVIYAGPDGKIHARPEASFFGEVSPGVKRFEELSSEDVANLIRRNHHLYE
jgi:hypothetical protein